MPTHAQLLDSLKFCGVDRAAGKQVNVLNADYNCSVVQLAPPAFIQQSVHEHQPMALYKNVAGKLSAFLNSALGPDHC
jgi:hypothetical protein